MLCELKEKAFFSGSKSGQFIHLHAYDVGVHRAEIGLSWVSMALSMARAGLSSQASKPYFRKRKRYPVWKQREGTRERQCSGAAAVPSPGTDPVLPPRRCWWSGAGLGKTSPYLQLREAQNIWKKAHSQGNLLLRRAHYLKPSTAHPAAELAGEPAPAHCCLGWAGAPWLWREVLDPRVLQRCGIITIHCKGWTVFDRWPRWKSEQNVILAWSEL